MSGLITTCSRCGTLYRARGDAADEPGRLCNQCWLAAMPRQHVKRAPRPRDPRDELGRELTPAERRHL